MRINIGINNCRYFLRHHIKSTHIVPLLNFQSKGKKLKLDDNKIWFNLFGECTMNEGNGMSNANEFNNLMKQSKDQLGILRIELQNLMVKFGLRSLTLYQAARKEPLRPNEMNSIIKYELTSAMRDFSEADNLEKVIELTKKEWKNFRSE